MHKASLEYAFQVRNQGTLARSKNKYRGIKLGNITVYILIHSQRLQSSLINEVLLETWLSFSPCNDNIGPNHLMLFE